MNNEQPKRIAAINDISGFGKCSLTVALPIISAAGVECACIPTALLSTHTGSCFSGWTFDDLTDSILPIAQHWHALGLHFDGIYSGYLANPRQGELIGQVMQLLRSDDTKIIIDPAMADNGQYYSNFDGSMAECFRGLIKNADLITPNITEACFLAGEEYSSAPHDMRTVERLMDRLTALGARSIAITGVSLGEGEIGVVARDADTGRQCVCMSGMQPGIYHGAGDVFCSALSALYVRGTELTKAVEIAERFTARCVQVTNEHDKPMHYGLDFESVLPELIAQI